MKKKTILAICVILLLAAVVAVGLIVRNRQTAQETAGAIALKAGGKTVWVQLKDLDQVAFSGETVNGKGERFQHEYRGIPLNSLLDGQQIDWTGASAVTAVSADQFSASYTPEEIGEGNKIYLAVEIDGTAVEGIESGTPGVQMVVFGDPNSKRNVRNLNMIEVVP